MRYGDVCTATCNSGFQLQGASERRCDVNGVNGAWSQQESKVRCVDVTPPQITCPANVTLATELNENFANVSWWPPSASDNSGYVPEVVSLPAVTEQPMKFPIGTSSVTYVALDRRGNKAQCTFYVTVHDVESPTVDQCESPPTFLMRDRDVDIQWDKPIFSDNSGGH